MPAPTPSISRNEFDALVKRSGLPLSEQQKNEFHAVYGYVEQIAERVRAGGDRRRESEPALVFKPTVR
jgi:hypothetical protein